MKTLVLSLVLASAGSLHVFAQTDKTERDDLLGRCFLVVVWGYEEAGNAPRDSHTFATFYDGDALAKGRVTPATIRPCTHKGIS
jgi:hypothetical protein